MSAPNKYVVTVNYLGVLTRGDIVTQKELAADAKDLLAEGSIRPATAEEAKSGESWVHEPVGPENLIIIPSEADQDGPPPPASTPTPAPKPKRPSRSHKKKPAITAPVAAQGPVGGPVVESGTTPETLADK